MSHYPGIRSLRRAAEVLDSCQGVVACKVRKPRGEPDPLRWELLDRATGAQVGHATLGPDGLHIHGVAGPVLREYTRGRDKARTTVRLPKGHWWALLARHGLAFGQVAQRLRELANGATGPARPWHDWTDGAQKAVTLYDTQWRAILARHGVDGGSIPEGMRTIALQRSPNRAEDPATHQGRPARTGTLAGRTGKENP